MRNNSWYEGEHAVGIPTQVQVDLVITIVK